MSADGDDRLQQEHVEDFPRPPKIEPVPCSLRVELGGAVVAETIQGLRALETHHAPTYYFPREDIIADLVPCKGRTFCEWKGVAEYYDVRLGDAVAEKAAWSYLKPSSTFSELAKYVSFYPGRMAACYVGPVRVTAQPGDSYGGWVTPNLIGPIKGAPDTRHW